jgi:hypothetical protein
MMPKALTLIFALLLPYFAAAQNITVTKKTSYKKIKANTEYCLSTESEVYIDIPLFNHKSNIQIKDKLNSKVKDFMKGMATSSNGCNFSITYSGEYVSDTLISIQFNISESGWSATGVESGSATLNLIVSEESSEVMSAPAKLPKKSLSSIEMLCRKHLKSSISDSGIGDFLDEIPTKCDLVESSTFSFTNKGTKFFVQVYTATKMFDIEVIVPYKELSTSKLLFGI